MTGAWQHIAGNIHDHERKRRSGDADRCYFPVPGDRRFCCIEYARLFFAN
jgi:hypothetical protein